MLRFFNKSSKATPLGRWGAIVSDNLKTNLQEKSLLISIVTGLIMTTVEQNHARLLFQMKKKQKTQQQMKQRTQQEQKQIIKKRLK